ncbi:putative xylanase/chitin deacetylase [Desulfosporosinus orientis DSM 765]|uniref:Putative xylanase/chitin deacetylase n=1 Tax=Desulfosporosinus orientis (strain ATCC 19365 / DSM 765 / NCIMB 8382 / VKM B-1628 / Singapore I) TaxID=768706 RepID=G7WFG9_DESOD|nr:polysaccharide deacetylase family protein [Desulfosporosinus orientis]AET68412.1 putative xylanase/chitin deacetylase [Desulfosporosinus orientis DSM 765]
MIFWLWLLLGIILFMVVYTILPDLFLHRLGLGSWKRQFSPGVALTFDDGPDPAYTPQLLNILGNHNIPAAFFVVGEKAQENPDLLKAILAQGHEIGVHSLQHRYAWFQAPWTTWRQWDEAVATVEHITGKPVVWIRPPWGTFNLALWIWMIVRHKKAVLWTSEGHDWKVSHKPEQIAQRVLENTAEGSIIVLHDSGGEKAAPGNTLKALEILCRRIREEQKLPFVKLEIPTWSMTRRLTYRFWEMWEKGFARLYKIERISANNLLRLSQKRYKGPDLYSSDGRLLAKEGDIVGEIHFDNARFMGKETDTQSIALKALHKIKPSLAEVAAYINQNPNYAEIKVFLGLTLIHRGVKRLGFEVNDVPITFSTRLIAFLQRSIMRIYHPKGKVRAEKMNTIYPKLVFITREQLVCKWLNQFENPFKI